jgi:hypothetical protein
MLEGRRKPAAFSWEFLADNEIAVTILLVCCGEPGVHPSERCRGARDVGLCTQCCAVLTAWLIVPVRQLGGWMLFLIGFVDIAETSSKLSTCSR